MQTDDGKVTSITAARKNRLPEEHEADYLCWQCRCGCPDFLLCNNGEVKCSGCGRVHPAIWGFTADEEGPGTA